MPLRLIGQPFSEGAQAGRILRDALNGLFGNAVWATSIDRNGNPIDEAIMPFDVTIRGTSYGRVNLKLTHAPHRESTRGSVITNLRWGELAPVLRATDYTGGTITLSRLSDGSYRLEIA